ncbi:DNA-binding transcriptional regulator, MerR family [Lentibacillus halodurans]|uniref:DNA-binding transcriptional regulator, MerR family n=1 Tax=Lentibacillus halodurans TaxID=237679 RepID=A0A1I0YA76_9BACI|nr:MerR family transcriptional regulator [Lentibacillus halodurans]SFB10171.1 DNA-binding transcriptional regulator, MerR family [Lentibacillus halodurans]
MLTIKEVAERASISPSTIRYYDDQGLLPFVQRDKNGYRLFKEEALFWLEFIGIMRSVGMSVKTLQRFTQLQMKGDETLDERMQIFNEHQEKLRTQKNEIEVALGKLEVIIKVFKFL